jgi:hypothetical protein
MVQQAIKAPVCENEVQFHNSLAAHLSATPTHSSGVWSSVAVMPRRCSWTRTIGQRFPATVVLRMLIRPPRGRIVY